MVKYETLCLAILSLAIIFNHVFLVTSNYWIGGNRLKDPDSDHWRWVSDGERLTVLDFEKGHQIQNTSQCIALWSQAKYSWRDQYCARSYEFICKT